MVAIVVEAKTGAANRAIGKGLFAFNASVLGKRRSKTFAVTVRDDDGVIRGGLIGEAWADWFFIQRLWIDESLRGGDVGTELVRKAEAEARAFGCTNAYVDTFSFQAPGFYRKMGYRIFGTLDGFPKGHKRHWLTKEL